MILAVVSCGQRKLAHRAPARELYTGSLFVAARRYLEATGTPYRVLSALHGVVPPDIALDPYDKTLAERFAELDRLDALTGSGHRERWVRMVSGNLGNWCRGVGWRACDGSHLTGPVVLHVHAGERYAALVREAAAPWRVPVEEPLAGLSLGRRLAWYAAALRQGQQPQERGP